MIETHYVTFLLQKGIWVVFSSDVHRIFAMMSAPFALAGESASLGAALIWALSITLFAKKAGSLSGAVLNFYKCLLALFFLGLLSLQQGFFWEISLEDGLMLALSGVIGLSIGDSAFYAALKRLGAQLTTSTQCLAPPIAALIALIFLGEKLTPLETLGLVITTSAVAGVLIMGPKAHMKSNRVSLKYLAIGGFYALLSAFCQGLGMVLSRKAYKTVDVFSGTFIRLAPAVLILGLVLGLSGQLKHLAILRKEPKRALWLAFASFTGAFLGLIFMAIGIKYTKTGIAAALNSTYPIFMLPISHFFLKEKVSWQSAIATLLAVLGIGCMLLKLP